MKHPLTLMASILLLSACQKAAPLQIPEASELPTADAEPALVDYPGVRDKANVYKLPPTVVPISDTAENFGIDLASLDERDKEIVTSAWKNYQLIVQGKRPDCPAAYGLSDGGSVMYDCGSYEIMRIKGLSGAFGYDYGPSLNLLNGQTLERLKYLTPKEMERLESAP
ncbi:hypothetical protein ACW7GZ_14530 [Luteimonas sp. A537]